MSDSGVCTFLRFTQRTMRQVPLYWGYVHHTAPCGTLAVRQIGVNYYTSIRTNIITSCYGRRSSLNVLLGLASGNRVGVMPSICI